MPSAEMYALSYHVDGRESYEGCQLRMLALLWRVTVLNEGPGWPSGRL